MNPAGRPPPLEQNICPGSMAFTIVLFFITIIVSITITTHAITNTKYHHLTPPHSQTLQLLSLGKESHKFNKDVLRFQNV